MKYLVQYLLPLLLSFSAVQVNAQLPNDTLPEDQDMDEEVGAQMEQNLDSMLNLWYVKNSIKNSSSFSYNNVDSLIYSNIPDSVFENRIKKIPSAIPLFYNEKVRQYIQFYLRHGKNTTPLIIGLSRFYFPLFEEVLEKKNMPHELKYLAIIESALNPRAVSSAGATGLWQLMYGTGRMYGMEINSFVDERRDPDRSSEAGIKFLKDLYEIYGDWHMVMAAYNCGPGNVNRAIRRSKGKRNYFELYRFLPRQTRNYVPCFVAAAYIMTYYKEHNIQPIPVNLPLNVDTVMVNSKIHLGQVSEVLNLPIEVLRDLNPQYKRDVIPAFVSYYKLKMPSEYTTKYVEYTDSIAHYKDSLFFDNRRDLLSVNASNYSTMDDDRGGKPADIRGKTKFLYTVKPGDTYGYISTWFGCKVSDLKYWNDAYSTRLKPGKKITIYVPGKKLPFYKKFEDMTFEEKQDYTAKNAVKTKVAKNSSNIVLDESFVYYTIQRGDNIGAISNRYPGVSKENIMKINNLSANDVVHLQIGQVLKIKRKNE